MSCVKVAEAGSEEADRFLSALRTRAEGGGPEIIAAVAEILDNVKRRGDAAVLDYCERFDGVRPEKLELDIKKAEMAALRLPAELLVSLENAAESIQAFHEGQKQQSRVVTREDGTILGQRVLPIERVGVYIPGGTAAYPSSVLMNVIPAKIAGVKEIIMFTPPFKDEKSADAVLAAAYIAGVDRIFTVGGAQAVAAMAFGTETIPSVDKITGPGNAYVAQAKRMVYGRVDIDMVAGPSEVLIIADDHANPVYAAADMLAQAEHDVLASAVLLCLSDDFAKKAEKELENQLAGLKREQTAAKSLQSYGCIMVCENLEQAMDISNAIAPEHLEILTEQPMNLLPFVRSAGSVFLGEHSPEPYGDYMAGPNHTLPTNGTARFFSPLSVDSFIKKSSFLYASEKALKNAGEDIIRLAETEGLTAHANSIRKRMSR